MAEEDEVVEEEPQQPPEEGGDSDESSDDFNMVVKKEQCDKAQRPEKRTATPSAKAKATETAQKKASDGKVAKVLGQARATLGALEAITPIAYWQRTVKPKDCEAKIEKAFDLATALTQMPEEEAKTLGKELQTKGEAILNSIETLNLVPTQDSEGGSGGFIEKVSLFETGSLDKLCLLPADCLNAVLSDVGRKLLEERVLGSRLFFFWYHLRSQCHIIKVYSSQESGVRSYDWLFLDIHNGYKVSIQYTIQYIIRPTSP